MSAILWASGIVVVLSVGVAEVFSYEKGRRYVIEQDMEAIGATPPIGRMRGQAGSVQADIPRKMRPIVEAADAYPAALVIGHPVIGVAKWGTALAGARQSVK